MAEKEAALLYLLLELLPGVAFLDMSIPVIQCLIVYGILNIDEKVLNVPVHAFERNGLLLESVAPVNLHSAVLEIAGTHCKPYRHALELPLGELESRTEGIPVVNLHTVSGRLKGRLYLIHLGEHGRMLLVSPVNRNHNHLDRCEGRRENESVVVSVSHHESAHEPGGNSPGGSPDILELAFLVSKLHVE